MPTVQPPAQGSSGLAKELLLEIIKSVRAVYPTAVIGDFSLTDRACICGRAYRIHFTGEYNGQFDEGTICPNCLDIPSRLFRNSNGKG